jgi:hypothetical protein
MGIEPDVVRKDDLFSEASRPSEPRRSGLAQEDERYYASCPLRKNRARIPVTVCHKQRCLFLTSENGKQKCGYGDPNKKSQF